jgi:NAD(P)-dependent dehydrogenase (short-subunit alcohol dehydrogenase family)
MSSNFTKDSTAGEVAAYYSSNIANKVILTTGVSPGGLGAFFAEAIVAQNPKLLILAGRDASKIQETADSISKAHPNVNTRALVLDLSDLKQVWTAAKEVLSYEEDINVLVNNAAVMASPYGTTKDGLEMQFGTGHVGHFFFTNLILAVKGRIVNITSDGHRLSPIRFDDWGFSVSLNRENGGFILAVPILTVLYRMAKLTTNGRHMGKPRRPTCYSP